MITETVKIENAAEFDEFIKSNPKGHMMQTSMWGRVKKEWDWTGFICRDDDGLYVFTGTLEKLI